MTNLVERFLRYVKIDTQSDPNSETTPSTSKQFNLANLLVKELIELGLTDANVDKNGYVMASLSANCSDKLPVIGFIAHLDTSPDFSGFEVKPQLIENYEGGDILLNKELNIVLSPSDFPELKNYIGQDLITTNGTTLLGADDKAGIAEIMTALEYFKQNPNVKHGTIKVGFTPDEEIGRGADLFDVQAFGADYAYTIDGGELGELEYENFNAAGALVTFKGRNIHPGYAKNKMVNSMLLAMEFNSLLPAHERPEHTTGYEGFIHLTKMEGTVEESKIQYIIRHHFEQNFESYKLLLRLAADFMNQKYGENTVIIQVTEQYKNMRKMIEPVIEIVNKAEKAMLSAGVVPLKKAIRGGTDGARLSFMGLPTPNIFGGGHNFHGKYEYIPIQSMQKAVEVIINIAKI